MSHTSRNERIQRHKQRTGRHARHYAPPITDTEPRLLVRDGTTYLLQDPEWTGQCYLAAVEAITRLGEGRGYFTPDDQYVLGMVTTERPDGTRVYGPHAWVEAGGKAMDLTYGDHWWDLDDYYTAVEAEPLVRYNVRIITDQSWSDFVTTTIHSFHNAHPEEVRS